MKCIYQSSVQETETSSSILGRKDLIHGIIVCKIFERAGGTSGQEPPLNYQFQSYTTLMAESEDELKILLMKMKEESEKTGLKLNI